MSLVEEYEEGEYGRAPKRLKTAEVEEGEELEEGEDSDSESAGLLGDVENVGAEKKALWTTTKYGPARRVGKRGHRIYISESDLLQCFVTLLGLFGNGDTTVTMLLLKY